MTIKELAAKLKKKYPDYANLSDEHAVERLIAKYPEYKSYLGHEPPKTPMFAGHAIKRMQTETEYTKQVVEHANAPYLAQRAVDEAISSLDRQKELQEVTHTNAVIHTQHATSLKVDPATANLIRMEEEKVKTDVDRAKQLSRLKVQEDWELHQSRLAAYDLEVQVDMQAALGMHMMDVEKLDYISGKIALLKAQNADPERIATLVKIRVQMERRLLEADDGKKLAGVDEEAEGSEDNRGD